MSQDERNRAAEQMLKLSGLADYLDKMGDAPRKVEQTLDEVGEVAKAAKVLDVTSTDATEVIKQAPPTATKPADEKQPPAPDEKPAEEQEAAPQTKIEMLRDSILQVVGSMQNATPEELSKAIEDTIVAAVNSAKEAEKPADSMPHAAQMQSQPQTTMTDKALGDATFTYAGVGGTVEPGQTVDLEAVNKSLTDLMQEVITDVEAIANAQEQDREAVAKSLEPVIKRLNELPATLNVLDQRLAAIEKQMNGKPRVASRDPLTVISGDKLPEEIQKSIEDEEFEPFLSGIRLKKEKK